MEQGETTTIEIDAFDPDDVDLVFDIEVSGESFIFDELPTINDDGQIELDAFTFGDADIVVSITDPQEATAEVRFSVNVPFIEPTGQVPDDFVPFSGQRQLSGVLPALRNDIYTEAPELTIDTSLNYRAILETVEGDITVDLFAANAPNTVNNFVNLAEDGFYDGVNFHRVIPGFVAQGGDPLGTGTGGPGFEFADELNNGLDFADVGTLAMANSGPDTNGSQFFFSLVPDLEDELADPNAFSIFGQISEGLDVLNEIAFTEGPNTDPAGPTVITRIRIEIV